MPLDGLLRLLSRREETVQARIEEIEADETHVGQTYREFLNDFDLELAPDASPRVRALAYDRALEDEARRLQVRIDQHRNALDRSGGVGRYRAALRRNEEQLEEVERRRDKRVEQAVLPHG